MRGPRELRPAGQSLDGGGQGDGEKPPGERQRRCAGGAVVYESRRGQGERGQRESEDEARECDEFARRTAPDARPATTPRRPGRTLRAARRRPEMTQESSGAPAHGRDPARVSGRAASPRASGSGGAPRSRASRRRRTACVVSRPRSASAQLAPPPAPATRLLCYNGAAPGPLLRLRKGEELKLRLVNRLGEGTTLSFPGLRAANAAAGIGGLTQPLVAPGGELDIRFTPPDSGFNLYCPDAGGGDRAADRQRALRPDRRRGGGRRRRRMWRRSSSSRIGGSTTRGRSRTTLPTRASAAPLGGSARS